MIQEILILRAVLLMTVDEAFYEPERIKHMLRGQFIIHAKYSWKK